MAKTTAKPMATKTLNTKKRVPKNPVQWQIQLSDEQKRGKESIMSTPYSIILGVAGTGKTLLACQIALDSLVNRMYDKIIITRPTVATEQNGFLPGTEAEKMEPWLVPIRSNFAKLCKDGSSAVKRYEEAKEIQVIALSYFRGQTFDNAICIIDEFQNLTKEQFAMAAGRLGKNSKMIFCGDPDQVDLHNRNSSASKLISSLSSCPEIISIVTLKDNHRNPAVSEILRVIYESMNNNSTANNNDK